MQGSYGMLVKDRGELIKVPVAKPERNHDNFTGRLRLEADGSLVGDMTMAMSGDAALYSRTALHELEQSKVRKALERFLNDQFAGATLTDVKTENLDQFDQELRITMKFKASAYSKNAGPLLLVRPRVIGHYWQSLDAKPRKYPYEFAYAESRTDQFDIELPAGFAVDELPRPVQTDVGFARYTAKSEMNGSTLHYKRTMEISDPEVPASKIEDLRRLFLSIAGDEKSSAVFKKTG
ncbi:MAG: hypothetical protein NVS9B15_17830 [Acidobacteriaceae bacterium]